MSNSKSSSFSVVTALPRTSTTETGIGTRFELIRTMSDGSTSSLAILPEDISVFFPVEPVEEEPEGLFGSAMGPGAICFVCPGSLRLPDWPARVVAKKRFNRMRAKGKIPRRRHCDQRVKGQ